MKYFSLVVIILLFIILLSSCLNIEFQINRDGSGELYYEMKSSGDLTYKGFEDETNKYIKRENEKHGEGSLKLMRLKDEGDYYSAKIWIDDIAKNENISFYTFDEFKIKNSEKLTQNLINADSGKEILLQDIKNTTNLRVVSFDGIENNLKVFKIKVVLPEKVLYKSKGVEIIKSDKVELKSDNALIIYNDTNGRKLNFILLFGIIIFILVSCMIGGYIVISNIKKQIKQ